ncbi:CHASE3 domain-containing protein [Ramlibacter ginsenosidimutans]|uniref:histidine kinase n=1 Tax=Ramlibacter ginsenosidimutans TaxID=502333 RepID=A0A934WLE8_9BURK|nr:CHASE3 domain-containing protein [Ramlibacter ginsenosidimutans]MBK6005343.1 CHASE3 domain-containing protein [Ramlibacter ginsenosidimutans]
MAMSLAQESPRAARRDPTLSGFVVAAVGAAVFVAGIYWVSAQQTRAQEWIGHTHEVLGAIATTRADLLEIQNGVRGFAITGRAEDLQPYEEARTAIRSDLRRLQDLTADNAVQQAHVAELQSALEPRLASAAAIVTARRTRGPEAALALVDAGEPTRQTAGLRDVLHAMAVEESRLLSARLAQHDNRIVAFWGTIAALLAALLATLSIFYRQQRRRELAERGLLESERRFHLMADSVTDYAIYMLDAAGRVQSWNPGAQRIKGYTPDEIVGQHFACFYPPEDRSAGKPAHALEIATAEGRFTEEAWRLRKDGSRFWASVTMTPLKDAQGRITGYAKITRDLTERMEAERAQHARELSMRLIAAQEEERRHIARELHDETGQSLTLIRMNLSELARQPGGGDRIVTDSIRLVEAAMAHIRSLSLRLRPPMLDDLGLSEALEWMLEQQARAAGWTTALEAPEFEERLPQDIETACFRIAQEALTNATRYSGATEVRVKVRLEPGQLLLEVRDNGRGFDLARYRSPEERTRHFGLVSMTERAALVGGELSIETAPGQGTSICARFPLPDGEAAALSPDYARAG